ncbi:MAG: hypothetical protein LUD77_00145, partial [Clostridiales bacterium]|nr:hypothetical protein [Clostridiales bacterium]
SSCVKQKVSNRNKNSCLKIEQKTIYVYSEYSDYLRLNIEDGSSDCYLDRTAYIDRLPDRICGVSVVSLEEDEEKETERKKREQREREERRIRAMSAVEEMKMERVPEDSEEFEPAKVFKLPPSDDRPVNKLKDICALSQYSVIRSNTRRIHAANPEIEGFTCSLHHITSHDMKITNTEADYEMSDYLYDYSPSSYNYSLTGFPAIGEKTNYNHILIINNKVYADKNLSSMEFDMLLQTLKQPREFSLDELIYRAKLKRKNKDIFDAREKYIKQEFVPRTDSFHIQSITLELSNYKPLCVTTIMMEKTFSLSEYLCEVLGFFEKMPLTAEEYEAINNGSFKNLSLGDFKRYLFIYQCLKRAFKFI